MGGMGKKAGKSGFGRTGLMLFMAVAQAFALDWAPGGEPAITQTADHWTVTFAVTESTDVEVAVINPEGNRIVRHLAAGRLGANPPAPLQSGTLSQAVVWDGRDDLRNPVANPGSMTVRVRAGMSVVMDRAAGADPYGIHTRVDEWLGTGTTFNGLEKLDDGNVALFTHPAPANSNILRVFTPKGEYVRTLFPVSNRLPEASAAAWGSVSLGSGSWTPTCEYFKSGPVQTLSPLKYLSVADLANFVPSPLAGRIGMLNLGAGSQGYDAGTFPFMSVWLLNLDGTIDTACVNHSGPLITTPALPATRYLWSGPLFFAPSQDRSAFFMSGFWETATQGTPGQAPSATSFYRDGRLFKVDMETRTATVFFDLDTVVAASADRVRLLGGNENALLHGVAADDSGRVFVCDRLHNRVLALDHLGALLGSIRNVTGADAVGFSAVTRALYVTRTVGASVILQKFADWRGSPAAAATVTLSQGRDDYFGPWRNRKTFVTVCETDEGTLVWLGDLMNGVSIYRDAGSSLVLYKAFDQASRQNLLQVFRVAADPRTEDVYVNMRHNLYKVDDWADPLFKPCTTSAGEQLNGHDPAVDGLRGYLYLRQNESIWSSWHGKIIRYALGDRLAPAPLPGRPDNAVSDTIVDVRGGSADNADHGIAIAPNGGVAVVDLVDYPAQGYSSGIRMFASQGTLATITNRWIVQDWSYTAGDFSEQIYNSGIRFDLQGNLFVGLKPASTAIDLPQEVKNSYGYSASVGSIYKYAPAYPLDSLFFMPQDPPLPVPLPVDFGSLGGATSDKCTCISAQFGMDLFGRLYAPNSCLSKLTVIDNNGNRVARVGTYGNIDDLREELAGAAGTRGNCTMGFPICADATEDYIYVSDLTNYALLRLKKEFMLDNMPEVSAQSRPSHAVLPFGLAVGPNPFHPLCRLAVSLPSAGRVRLAVYDAAGRCVRVLADGNTGAGSHGYFWDGRNASGKLLAGGVYLFRLEAGNKCATGKAVFLR